MLIPKYPITIELLLKKTVIPTQTLLSGMPEQELLRTKLCLSLFFFYFSSLASTRKPSLDVSPVLLTDSLGLAHFPPTPHHGWGSTMELWGIQVVEPKCSYPFWMILPVLLRSLHVASHRKCNSDWQTLKEIQWLHNWKSRVVPGSCEAWSKISMLYSPWFRSFQL